MPPVPSGNDETFLVLVFAFVATFTCILYAGTVLGVIFSSSRRAAAAASVADGVGAAAGAARVCVTRPGVVATGARALLTHRPFAREYVVPIVSGFFRVRFLLLIAFFVLLPIVAYQKLMFDPYEELGLEADASASAVKKAYRKLSMQLHPDKNPTEEARLKYKRVRKAYQALVDPDKWDEDMKRESREYGIALPSFLTDKRYRVYSMALMMSLLLGVPLWLILKLAGRTDPPIAAVRAVARSVELSRPFFAMLGRPALGGEREAAALRAELAQHLRLLQRQGYFDAVPGAPPPPGEPCAAAFPCADLVARYGAAVGSVAELRELCAAAAPAKKGKAAAKGGKEVARVGQEDAAKQLQEQLWIGSDAAAELADAYRDEPPLPPGAAGAAADAQRRAAERRAHPERAQPGDAAYTPPSINDARVAQWALNLTFGAMRAEAEGMRFAGCAAPACGGCAGPAPLPADPIADPVTELAGQHAVRVARLIEARKYHLEGKMQARDDALCAASKAEQLQADLLRRLPGLVRDAMRAAQAEMRKMQEKHKKMQKALEAQARLEQDADDG